MTLPRGQINLYQAEFRPARVALPTRQVLLAAAVFAAGLGLLHAWDRWQFREYQRQAEHITRQAEQMEGQLQQLARDIHAADPRVVAEAEALEARARALQAAQAALAGGVLGSEHGYAPQFLALSRATTPGAWLTRVELDAGGREMSLAGGALDGEAPARLIAALGRQPQFTGLSYAALEVSPAADPAGDAAPRTPAHLEFSLLARLPQAAAGGAPTEGKP